MCMVCEFAQFAIRFYAEYFMSYLETRRRLSRPSPGNGEIGQMEFQYGPPERFNHRHRSDELKFHC